MKVAGVDLSTKKIAIVVTNGKWLRWREIVSDISGAGPRREAMFAELYKALQVKWLRDVIACHIEDITFIRSGKNELDMSKVQGGVQFAYSSLGIPCFMHNNMTIKKTFGLNRKDKDVIVWYVQKRFNVEVPSHDVADAATAALHGMIQNA